MFQIKLGKKSYGIYILAASLVLGLLAFIFGRNVKNLQDLGYLGVFIANLLGSATIILPVPSFATTIAVGAFLSPILTAIFSAAGSTLGELTGYYAGIGGRDVLKKGDKRVKKVQDWINMYGLWVIFILAAIPNPLFDIAGIISGVSKLPVWKYLLIVFSGKLIKFLVLAYTGFGILKLFNLAF